MSALYHVNSHTKGTICHIIFSKLQNPGFFIVVGGKGHSLVVVLPPRRSSLWYTCCYCWSSHNRESTLSICRSEIWPVHPVFKKIKICSILKTVPFVFTRHIKTTLLYKIVLDLCSCFRKKHCLPDFLLLKDQFIPWHWYCLLPVWVPDCCLLSCMTLPPSWIKALVLWTLAFVSLCTWVPTPALSQRDQRCLNLSPGVKRNI